MAVLIGIALEMCVACKIDTTLPYPQLQQTVNKARRTSSEMNELVSSVLRTSFPKMSSNSPSNCLLTFPLSSFTAETAFLLNVDLKLSLSFIKSGTIAFVTLATNSSE